MKHILSYVICNDYTSNVQAVTIPSTPSISLQQLIFFNVTNGSGYLS